LRAINSSYSSSSLESAKAGDQIWAAEGVYKPQAEVARAATFALKSGVALYGGFSGKEAFRQERDWLAHP
jgi:hypothetical protein